MELTIEIAARKSFWTNAAGEHPKDGAVIGYGHVADTVEKAVNGKWVPAGDCTVEEVRWFFQGRGPHPLMPVMVGSMTEYLKSLAAGDKAELP